MEQARLRRSRTRRRRRPAQLTLASLLLAAIAATAFAAMASTPTALEEKAAVVADLEAITGLDAKDQKYLDKALDELRDGMAAEYWSADGASLEGDADEVFKSDAKAVKGLEKIGDPAGMIEVIARIDESLARAAIDAAAAAGADTAKAEETMAKAARHLADGKIYKAIEYYGKAWKEAAKAEPASASASASGTKSSSGDKYSEYEVVFVRADTIGTTNPIFLTVAGDNRPGTPGDTGAGNEGFLFSPEFGPADTFLDAGLWPTPDGGIMQLHVSCSDAFADGIGSKSDPAATSQWRVNSIHIVKYKYGEIDKECEVLGTGLPVPEVIFD